MLRIRLVLAAVLSALPLLPHSASACSRGADCYDRVRLPDVYRAVERPVLVRPGYREVVETPPVVARRAEPVVVAPGRWRTERIPALYSTELRTEMVAPPRVGYYVTPPVVRRVEETVMVRPGGYRWEVTENRWGGLRKCKVPVAPELRTVTREVMVEPPRRVSVVSPAVYRQVPTTVMVRPPMKRKVYQPAVVAWRERHVLVRPGMRHVIEHPPVIARERHHVLVRQGGYGWQRASDRW